MCSLTLDPRTVSRFMIKLFSRVVGLISRISKSNIELEDPDLRQAKINALGGNSLLSTLYTRSADDSILDDMIAYGGSTPGSSDRLDDTSVSRPAMTTTMLSPNYLAPFGGHHPLTSSNNVNSALSHSTQFTLPYSTLTHSALAHSHSHSHLHLHSHSHDHHLHRRHTYDSSLRTALPPDNPEGQLLIDADKLWTELDSWIQVLEDNKLSQDRIQVGNRAYAHAMKVGSGLGWCLLSVSSYSPITLYCEEN